jgi:phosphoribosylglycinamide formyltransferase-1
MRILTPIFTESFAGKLVNIHPSLLPKYPGLNTHQRALEAGDTYQGATVHFVTHELDGGPPILQGRVKIRSSDTAESLAARILTEVEHKIYPLAVQWLVQNRVEMRDGGAWMDGELLGNTGFQYIETGFNQ